MPFDPSQIIDISGADYCAWQDVIDAVTEVVKSVEKPDDTGTRIYSHFIYETDPQTMLGKITSAMKAEGGTSNGRIRCWTLGISAAQFVVNGNNDNPIVGGQNTRWQWQLNIDVWGLFEYGSIKEDQAFALNRARMVAAAIYRNAPVLVAGIPLLSTVSQLTFPPESIQPTPMSGAQLAIIAAGRMTAVVDEALSV